MDIEFKEKTYEKYFGHELSLLTDVTYSPDQCDEAVLGFDEAFFMPESWFWRYGPYVRHRRRGRLTGVQIEDFNRHGKLIADHLPPFKFNLFVQFKRPKFLASNGAKQWSDWRRSYYRYETTPHQQEALEELDAHSHGRAATIYASPAFWQASALWSIVKRKSVVAQSNIASVGKLKGHRHYTYAEPGCFGKGHSEAVDIEGETLVQIIERGIERNEPIPLNQHLKKAALAITETVRQSDSASSIFNQVQSARGYSDFDQNSLYDSIEVINAFSEAFGVRYYAVGR